MVSIPHVEFAWCLKRSAECIQMTIFPLKRTKTRMAKLRQWRQKDCLLVLVLAGIRGFEEE